MDDTVSFILVIFLIILVALSAFFSSSETAFSSVNKIRLKQYASDGNKKATRTLVLYDSYDEVLSTILIGNNVVNITSASVGTLLFTGWFGTQGVAISTIVMTLLVLIFGEILPKSLAKVYAEKVAMDFSSTIHVLMFILKPFTKFFYLLKIMLVKNATSTEPSVTEKELKHIINEIENEGVLEEQEGKLVRSALDFDDILSEEILTPRVDVIGVDINDTIENLKDLFFKTKYSRIPVFKETIDNITGVITQQRFFTYIIQNKEFEIKDLVQPIIHIPPTRLISELMIELQSKKLHMSVITDEYGGTLGIITLEDILEELVGDIWDEHESVKVGIEPLGDKKMLINGDVNLYDLFDEINFDYTNFTTSINTVNGWVMDMLDKMPQIGDSFIFDNMHCVVEYVDEKRVCRILLEILDDDSK